MLGFRAESAGPAAVVFGEIAHTPLRMDCRGIVLAGAHRAGFLLALSAAI
jgi:hypothetical protein